MKREAAEARDVVIAAVAAAIFLSMWAIWSFIT